MSTQNEPAENPSGAAIFSRLMEAYGVTSMAELADKMGMREKVSTVKNWKQRESVPLEYCIRAALDTKRSLDWIVFGRGPAFLGSSSRKSESSGRAGEPLDAHGRYEAAAELAQLRNAIAHGVDEGLLTEAYVAVTKALDLKNLELPPEKLIKLVLLIYEYEAAQRSASPKPDSTVQGTVERFLKLVA